MIDPNAVSQSTRIGPARYSSSPIEMMKEASQLFCHLLDLIHSCSTSDIVTDIFENPAQPVRYQAALQGIRDCIHTIRSSGISRQDLLVTVTSPGFPCSSELCEIVTITDLVPLMGVGFSAAQKQMVGKAVDNWSLAVSQENPVPVREILNRVLCPLTLADLLAPDITHMKRFKAFMVLQLAGQLKEPLEEPAWEAGASLPLVLHDDPATFQAAMDLAFFRFLVKKGIIEQPIYPETVLQALYDAELLRMGGSRSAGSIPGISVALQQELYDAGREQQSVHQEAPDLPVLFSLALPLIRKCMVPVTFQDPGRTPVYDAALVGRAGGTVLAGYATAACEKGCDPALHHIIRFSLAAASRPSGRKEPDNSQKEICDRIVDETRNLVCVLSNDYRLHAVPGSRGGHRPRPLIDIVPGQHTLLYERDELAYRSPEAVRALALEALYLMEEKTCNPELSGDPTRNPVFSRFSEILLMRRSLTRGMRRHPGAGRWVTKFLEEAYDEVSFLMTQIRISRNSREEQFLEAALQESRLDGECRLTLDSRVHEALEVTRDARFRAGDPECLPAEVRRIILEEIWPRFRSLGEKNPNLPIEMGQEGQGTDSTPSVTLEAEKVVPRVDASVPGPDQLSSDTTGSVVGEGPGPSFLQDEGIHVSGMGPGPGRVDRPDPLPSPASPSATQKMPGSTGRGPQSKESMVSSAQQAAGCLEEACTRSFDLLDALSDRRGDDSIRPSGETQDTASSLLDLARTMEEHAKSLQESLDGSDLGKGKFPRSAEEGTGRAPETRGTGHKRHKEWEEMLRLSKKIAGLTQKYRQTVQELFGQPDSPGGPPGPAGIRTGMARQHLEDLWEAGAEFQVLAGCEGEEGEFFIRLPLPQEDQETKGGRENPGIGRMTPSFASEKAIDPELWESLSYFDDSFGGGINDLVSGPQGGGNPVERAEKKSLQEDRLLTGDALAYLDTLRKRTVSDWETMEEKAERLRRIALLETNAVREEDYELYQKFYQPVAGHLGVARKNILQVLQKERPRRDLTELFSGDDIDEENLAAVRTTMRIFRESGRQKDETLWALSLLVDASSSMHDETVTKKLEASIGSALLFGEAVNRIAGIRFEIAAFADVEYIPLKRYQDEWNMHQACHLIRQVIRASGGTNDVGAVKSALERMNRLRMNAGSNRMIFVITDGQSGVGGRDQMRSILSDHKGTRIFGWGIGPDMEMVEETYYPYGTWVPDISRLPGSLGEVLRRELRRPVMGGWKNERQCTTEFTS